MYASVASACASNGSERPLRTPLRQVAISSPARARPVPPPCRATDYPSNDAHHRKEHHCRPSLRIWKLICDDRHRNCECCYPAHRSYRHAAQVNHCAEKGGHFPFTVSPSSTKPADGQSGGAQNRTQISTALSQASGCLPAMMISPVSSFSTPCVGRPAGSR